MSQLKVNSIVPAGGLPSGANGGIIQVKQTIKKDVFTFTQTVANGYIDLTGLSVAITPSSNSNKILVVSNVYNGASNNAVVFFRLLRGSTFIEQPSGTSSSGANYNAHAFSYYDNTYQDSTTWSILDSPATTSETTYKIQTCVTSNTGCINAYAGGSQNNYFGISMITAYEVSA
tara:strand:- start:189 stop:710 length:522 start_codon:yes stop_codon:yes gene_type:complete